MQWISDNWLLLLLGGGMLAMHLFGHGKRGGHGGHGGGKGGGGCCGGRKAPDKPEPELSTTTIPPSGPKTGADTDAAIQAENSSER
jgi:hypothetical protein